MANTEFYRKAKSTTDQITWKDIFSEFNARHSKRDMEYAFLAGTSLDTANESNMLDKWRKPWLFWRVFLALAAVGALAVFAVYGGNMTGVGATQSSYTFIFVFLPMIIPLTLTILFWELNIPRNISIYEVLGYFLVGAVLCFFANSIMFQFVKYVDEAKDTALGAPLREEPAKLAASVAMLFWFSRQRGKKMYGLTGLVIGAAVGTGFSVFESISYSFSYGMDAVFVRVLYAAIGHTMFAAPYTAAIALHTRDSKLSKESFLNADFALTFACSVLMHMFWNSQSIDLPTLVKAAISTVVLWGSALYMVRKCLRQIVTVAGGDRRGAGTASVVGLSGCFAGRRFSIPGQGLRIGREPSNDVIFPQQYAAGISRSHCTVQFNPQTQTFTLIDQGSSYGTYLQNGTKLSPGMPMTLHPNDTFYLAKNTNLFRVSL